MNHPPFHISIHVGDYLKKTPNMGPLTWEHHGIYCSLRFLAWNTPGCSLPTDEVWIARQMGCTIEIFKEKVRHVLHQHFKQVRNRWRDKDLYTAYNRAVSFSKTQAARAKCRKTKGSDSSPGNATSLLPSKKKQQHRENDSVVGKKKVTKRWASRFKTTEGL